MMQLLLVRWRDQMRMTSIRFSFLPPEGEADASSGEAGGEALSLRMIRPFGVPSWGKSRRGNSEAGLRRFEAEGEEVGERLTNLMIVFFLVADSPDDDAGDAKRGEEVVDEGDDRGSLSLIVLRRGVCGTDRWDFEPDSPEEDSTLLLLEHFGNLILMIRVTPSDELLLVTEGSLGLTRWRLFMLPGAMLGG